MNLEITITPRHDYLEVVATGIFDHAQLEETLRAIFGASVQHGLRNILLDSRTLEGEISLLARYDIGTIAAKLQCVPVRLAFLASEAQIWPDRFGENVANNRGVKAKVTADRDEALEWLRQA